MTELFAHNVDRRERLRVVHPGRAEHTDRAEMFAVDDDRCDDNRTRRKRFDAVLDTDRDRHAALDDVADQRHDDKLLLERVENGPHDFDRVECVGNGGDTSCVDLIDRTDLVERFE